MAFVKPGLKGQIIHADNEYKKKTANGPNFDLWQGKRNGKEKHPPIQLNGLVYSDGTGYR